VLAVCILESGQKVIVKQFNNLRIFVCLCLLTTRFPASFTFPEVIGHRPDRTTKDLLHYFFIAQP
jgi:hypothetical protein